MGRCVVVGAIACGFTLPASAQPDAQPPTAAPRENADLPPIVVRPAPAESSWYATLAPAREIELPARARARFRHGVQRGGLLALAGLTRTVEASFARVDVGLPTPTSRLRGLRTLLSTEVGYDNDAAGPMQTSASMRSLALAPTLQYDVRLPFELASGDLVFVLGAGIAWSRTWVRLPEEPFWPSAWEHSTAYQARFETAIHYRARSGLVVGVYPITLALPLGAPEPPDARWMTSEPTTRYSVSIVGGFQFR